jgi:hypothetical protein
MQQQLYRFMMPVHETAVAAVDAAAAFTADYTELLLRVCELGNACL